MNSAQRCVPGFDQPVAFGIGKAVGQGHQARGVQVIAASGGIDGEPGEEAHWLGEIGPGEGQQGRYLLESGGRG